MTIKNLNFRKETLLVVLILIIGAFLRLYRISDYLTFLGDEGRDVLVVKKMIVEGKFTLLGPMTSVGNMYLGPLYYYMMFPFLWLWRLDPTGPAVMVALFGIATIFLIYKFSQEFFSAGMGMIASLLYAVSPLVILYSRSSWNPNIMPFFSLLTVYSLTKVVLKKNFRFLILAAFSLGIVLQSHYLGLIIAFTSFLILAFLRPKIPLGYYLGAALVFFFLLFPYFLFNIRHDFTNLKAVVNFLTSKNETVGLGRNLTTALGTVEKLFKNLIAAQTPFFGRLSLFLGLSSLIIWLKSLKSKKEKIPFSFFILLLWFSTGILSLSFYKGIIFDYYLGFLFPLPFFFVGYTVDRLWRRNFHFAVRFFLLVAVSSLLFINLKNSPVTKPPMRLLEQTETISRLVLEKTEDKPFNFALVASANSDYAYRYFFEILGRRAVPLEEMVTEQLMIVCENTSCGVLGNPLWEIAGFGRAEIAGTWDVSVVKVYKLIHHSDSFETIGKPVKKGI